MSLPSTVRAKKPKKSNALGEMVRLEVKLAEFLLADVPKVLTAPLDGQGEPGGFFNYNYKLPAFIYAHLFRLPHADNPFQGDEACADRAIAIAERWVAAHEAHPGGGVAEWPVFAATEVFALLRERFDERLRKRWQAFVEAWIGEAQARPFGFTAPNHDCWRCVALFRAGKVFKRPEWSEQGVFLLRQLLTYQSAEGFWEEGRHHGPSMKYNNVMLAGLAWMYRLTGDEAFGEAAKKLARFMACWSFPDGTSVGAFDGRQSTSAGLYAPICPGMELIPEGRAFHARVLELWRALGKLEDVTRFGPSTWYTYFSSFFFASANRYFLELAPDEDCFDAQAALPLDTEGTYENHSAAFDGLMHRRGPWVLALSSQNSDVPKDASSVNRLERQSRIELWHEAARLVLGGGHNRNDAPVPYANAIVQTGFAGVFDFGRIEPAQGAKRRSYYLPRLAASRMRDGAPVLAHHFAHGTIEWRFDLVQDETCAIEAAWRLLGVKRLNLQLPLIVWHGAQLRLDGKPVDAGAASPLPVTKSLEAAGGPFGKRVTLRLPKGVACRVHFPLDVLLGYKAWQVHTPERFTPPFRMALASCQWDDPPRQGKARFEIAITEG